MKIALYNFSKIFAHYRKAVGFLLSFVFVVTAHGASATPASSGRSVWYDLIVVVLIVLCLWIIYVIQKSSKILSQNGYSITDLDFPIFKKMSEHGIAVAVMMAILVLIGMYFVVTYGQ